MSLQRWFFFFFLIFVNTKFISIPESANLFIIWLIFREINYDIYSNVEARKLVTWYREVDKKNLFVPVYMYTYACIHIYLWIIERWNKIFYFICAYINVIIILITDVIINGDILLLFEHHYFVWDLFVYFQRKKGRERKWKREKEIERERENEKMPEDLKSINLWENTRHQKIPLR